MRHSLQIRDHLIKNFLVIYCYLTQINKEHVESKSDNLICNTKRNTAQTDTAWTESYWTATLLTSRNFSTHTIIFSITSRRIIISSLRFLNVQHCCMQIFFFSCACFRVLRKTLLWLTFLNSKLFLSFTFKEFIALLYKLFDELCSDMTIDVFFTDILSHFCQLELWLRR